MTLKELLTMVGTAPVGQLRPDLAAKARSMCNASKEEIHKFFEELYTMGDSDVSSFVRAMVNPKFTRGYD